MSHDFESSSSSSSISTAVELMLNNADELLAKACINEKGQETSIKALANDQKEGIVNDCSPKAALTSILSQTFLATPEGRKLGRDLIRKIGIDIVWKNVKIMIKGGSATRHYCFYFGQTLIELWKKLEKEETEDETSNEKSQMENLIFEDLFRLAISTQGTTSEKFIAILIGTVIYEKSVSLSQMLFKTSNHILWKTLDAPDMISRYNSAIVFFCLYPLDAAADENLDYDLKEKQHEVLLQLMKDDWFQIRVDAVEAAILYLKYYWQLLNSRHRECYWDTIIDELIYDENAEVRLAIFESLPLLYSCPSENTKVEHALKMMSLPGLTDPKDKIRLAAVNALLQLQNHSDSCLQVVKLQDLLTCLDVETCEEVETGLARILLPFLCRDDGISVDDRYHAVEQACTLSRYGNGMLKFHKIIGAKKMISNQVAALQIITIVLGISNRLRLSPLTWNGNYPEMGIGFDVIKTCLDCASVLFESTKSRLNDDPEARHYAVATKVLGKAVSRILEHPIYNRGILGESALVLATFLPQSSLDNSRIFTNGVIDEDYDSENMNGCFLQLATWDMDTLILIIERGLLGIVKKFELDKKLDQRRQIDFDFSQLAPDSSKDKDRKPIEIIAKILASPPTNEYFMKNFEVFVQRFQYILKVLVENMPSLIQNNQEELWTRIYEVYSLLTICIKNQINASNNPECSSTVIENDENNKEQEEEEVAEEEHQQQQSQQHQQSFEAMEMENGTLNGDDDMEYPRREENDEQEEHHQRPSQHHQPSSEAMATGSAILNGDDDMEKERLEPCEGQQAPIEPDPPQQSIIFDTQADKDELMMLCSGSFGTQQFDQTLLSSQIPETQSQDLLKNNSTEKVPSDAVSDTQRRIDAIYEAFNNAEDSIDTDFSISDSEYDTTTVPTRKRKIVDYSDDEEEIQQQSQPKHPKIFDSDDDDVSRDASSLSSFSKPSNSLAMDFDDDIFTTEDTSNHDDDMEGYNRSEMDEESDEEEEEDDSSNCETEGDESVENDATESTQSTQSTESTSSNCEMNSLPAIQLLQYVVKPSSLRTTSSKSFNCDRAFKAQKWTYNVVIAGDVLPADYLIDALRTELTLKQSQMQHIIVEGVNVCEKLSLTIDLLSYLNNPSYCGQVVAEHLFPRNFFVDHILRDVYGNVSQKTNRGTLSHTASKLFFDILYYYGGVIIEPDMLESWMWVAREGVNKIWPKAGRNIQHFAEEDYDTILQSDLWSTEES